MASELLYCEFWTDQGLALKCHKRKRVALFLPYRSHMQRSQVFSSPELSTELYNQLQYLDYSNFGRNLPILKWSSSLSKSRKVCDLICLSRDSLYAYRSPLLSRIAVYSWFLMSIWLTANTKRVSFAHRSVVQLICPLHFRVDQVS